MIFGLIGVVLGAVIGSAIFAPVLMLAARLVGDRKPDYSEAFVALFWGNIAVSICNFILGLVFLEAEDPLGPAVISVAVGFVVLTLVLGAKLEMTFGRAALTSLVMYAVIFAVLFVLLLSLGMLGAAAG